MAISFRVGMDPDGTIHMDHEVIQARANGFDFDPKEYAEQIRRCVYLGLKWHRKYGELNRLFGMDAYSVGDPEELVKLLERTRSHDVRERCDAIEKIAEYLEARHPDDQDEHLKWLTTANLDLKGEMPIRLMVFGGFQGLQTVAQSAQDALAKLG